MKLGREELTKEEVAELIAVSIFGFCMAIKGVMLSHEDMTSIRNATIESIEENSTFLKEMSQEYNSVLSMVDHE